MRRGVVWLGGIAAAGFLAMAAVDTAVRRGRLEPMLVRGESMRPTLVPGQRIAVGPVTTPLPRGAVVVLRRPDRRGLEVIKRVVGLPGERVRLLGATVEVGGRVLAEPYLRAPGGGPPAPEAGPWAPEARAPRLDVRLGPEEYLVLGDHREASTDGRSFGPVRASELVGVARFAYWPPRRLLPG